MTKPITITISGIKCDNEECGYIDNTVGRDNYPEYVNKPCPKCGSILLTQADYETVVQLEGIVADLDIDIPEDLLGEEVLFDVGMDGTGKIDMTKREEE